MKSTSSPTTLIPTINVDSSVRGIRAIVLSFVLLGLAGWIGWNAIIALLHGPGHGSAGNWAALLTSCILFYKAVASLIPAINEVRDAGPVNEIVERVRNPVAGSPYVIKLVNCHVRKIGFNYSVDIHIDDTLSITKCQVIAQEVKSSLLERKWRIKAVLVHVEPSEEDYFADDDEYWLA